MIGRVRLMRPQPTLITMGPQCYVKSYNDCQVGVIGAAVSLPSSELLRGTVPASRGLKVHNGPHSHSQNPAYAPD